MYKVIYQKNNGKVVGVYPIKYETVKEFDVESGKEIERQVDTTQVFFNKNDYALVEIETIPQVGTNQYLVYQNGMLWVNTNYPNYEALAEKYIREKYTLSQELAILRQRDTKIDEFNEYFNYAESCKARAKIETTTI